MSRARLTKRVIRARLFKRVVGLPKSRDGQRWCPPVRFTHIPAASTSFEAQAHFSASAVASFSSRANLSRPLCCWASTGAARLESGEINEQIWPSPQGPP